MPAKRIATGIWKTPIGFRVQASFRGTQRERRFPLETGLAKMKTWQEETRHDLRTGAIIFAVRAGTLDAAIRSYLPQIKHLASYKSKRSELYAWAQAFHGIERSSITAADIRTTIARWSKAKLAPKTIHNRLITFRAFWRAVDGAERPTPADDVTAPQAPQTVPTPVPDRIIRRVALILKRHERKGWLRDAKTRARFMVLAATGKRPSELKRAIRSDVDLTRGIWRVRTGKGGYGPPLLLNGDMRAAWRLFIDAEAFGHFDTRSFERRVYKARWPRRYRLYNLRHSVGLAYSESGVDLADVQLLMGHRDIRTTRQFYVPALDSRLSAAVRAIDRRFGWEALPEPLPETSVEKRGKERISRTNPIARRTTKTGRSPKKTAR